MKKQSAALLDDPKRPRKFLIHIRLQEGKTVVMEFNDRDIAENHYNVLRGVGVLSGLVIKEIEFESRIT